MNIKDALNLLLNKIMQDPIAFLLALLTVMVPLILHKINRKDTYLKERYERVIFPMFITLEPFFYAKTITPEIVEKVKSVCEIANKNRMYIGGFLLEQVDHCNKQLKHPDGLSKEQYIYLCSRVSIEYDRCCEKLGIKKRNIFYKWNNNQLHPNKFSIINVVFNYCIWFLHLYIFIVIVGVIAWIITLITQTLNF